MKLKKRIISTFISLALMLSVVPINAGLVSAVEADTTPPEIDVSGLSASISSGGSVAKPGDTVTISVKVTDDSDIYNIYCYYRKPITGNNSDTIYFHKNIETGLYEAAISITDQMESGTWELLYIYACDVHQNNKLIYNINIYENTTGAIDLSAFDFVVEGTHPDTTPPEIDVSGLSASISSGGSVAKPGDTVTISVKVTDDSDIYNIYCYYRKPITGNNSDTIYFHKNIETGLYEAAISITDQMESGTWELLYIYACDVHQNNKLIYNINIYENTTGAIDLSAFDFTIASCYKITFNTCGGSSIDPQYVLQGEKAVKPSPDPTRAGFDFAGWYKDASFENEYNFNDVVSKDLTLYAKWNTTIGLNSYNATTDEDMSGGKFSVTGSYGDNEPTYGWMFATVDEGAEITLKVFPDAGNKFVGWYEGVYVPIYKDGKLYSQTVLPKDIDDPDTIVSTDEEYTFSIDNETMLCVVFEKCTNHEFGTEQIKKATPNENGYIYHVCNICGEEETVVPLLKVSNISLEGTSFTYTGKEIKPKVKVANASEELSSDCYTIKYSDNVNVGKATVTVTLKGQYYEGSKTLTFEIKEAPSLKLDKTSANVVCGNSLTLKATLKGVTGKVSWKSSDTKIATVDSNGKVTSKMAGTVTITASASGMNAACKITVLYKDVTSKSDFWYAPTNYLTASGVVKGYANQTEFRPTNDCTRAQMVTFLYRLQGEPKTKSNSCKFTDVSNSDYYYKPVIWAVEKGITTGVSSDKFDPKGVCTRAQTVTFLWRMANKPEPKTKVNPFPDVKEKAYYYKATLWASEMKILAGLPDGTFNPQGKCLRRQMVTFLYKYDKFINGKG